jgi:hypothetical protein
MTSQLERLEGLLGKTRRRGKNNIKMDLKGTGFKWFRIGTSGGLL